jgi:hypothetical protein
VILDGAPAGAEPRALGRLVDASLPGLRTALIWSVAARRVAASA